MIEAALWLCQLCCKVGSCMFFVLNSCLLVLFVAVKLVGMLHVKPSACNHSAKPFGSGVQGTSNMVVHFEQAALLATAWANNDVVKGMAITHSLVRLSGTKKISRSPLFQLHVFNCCMLDISEAVDSNVASFAMDSI